MATGSLRVDEVKQDKKAVNSNAYKYLQSLLAPTVKVVDLYVEGKWLKAELSSGVRLSVKNRSYD